MVADDSNFIVLLSILLEQQLDVVRTASHDGWGFVYFGL